MSDSNSEALIFRAEELLPATWRHFIGQGPLRAFNPGLLRDGDGWIFASRIVTPDGRRRISACRLDASFQLIGGSHAPLSDHVRFRPDGHYPEIATQWFADPRLYRFEGRLFVYWNSGWHEPRNYQFLQELDSATLLPRGHPRELLLAGERQKLEKNWTLFDAGGSGSYFAVYSILPHRVLHFSLDGDGDILFSDAARGEWTLQGYPPAHGGLRGGAPPCLHDGAFWSFCHSVHDGVNGYRYAPAAYCFAPTHPFTPTAQPISPLAFAGADGDRRTHERLNPAVGEVIYPCGAAWDGTRWAVSHGVNDESCAISFVTPEAVRATLRSVGRSVQA